MKLSQTFPTENTSYYVYPHLVRTMIEMDWVCVLVWEFFPLTLSVHELNESICDKYRNIEINTNLAASVPWSILTIYSLQIFLGYNIILVELTRFLINKFFFV